MPKLLTIVTTNTNANETFNTAMTAVRTQTTPVSSPGSIYAHVSSPPQSSASARAVALFNTWMITPEISKLLNTSIRICLVQSVNLVVFGTNGRRRQTKHRNAKETPIWIDACASVHVCNCASYSPSVAGIYGRISTTLAISTPFRSTQNTWNEISLSMKQSYRAP